MDDTLLNGQEQISDSALKALREAQARGIRVILASGRAEASMRPFVLEVGSAAPYIACNGAEIYEPLEHRMLEGLSFSADMAKVLVDFALENDSYVHTYEDDFFVYEREREQSRAYTRSSGLQGKCVGDLRAYLTRPVPKLLCVDEPAKIARMLEMGRERFGEAVTFSVSKPMFLEMTPPGATKGAALARMGRYVPIDPETTLAFGDSLNDLSMLRWAKYGVAMGNARDEVKAGAFAISTPNTQDGVAWFLNRHVLKEAVPT